MTSGARYHRVITYPVIMKSTTRANPKSNSWRHTTISLISHNDYIVVTVKNIGLYDTVWYGINKKWYTHSVLTAIFPGEPGSAGCPLILLLHLFLDCASFWDRPKLSMSFLTQSHQVFFGRPLSLNSFNFQRYTTFDLVISSFRSTCPNHLNLIFLTTTLLQLSMMFYDKHSHITHNKLFMLPCHFTSQKH